MKNKKCAACISITLITLTFLLFAPVFGSQSEEAEARIKEAENMVLDCYGAVVEAEKASANVSDMLTTLNNASWSLALAKHAYAIGEYDSALEYANQTLRTLQGFIGEAKNLQENAEKTRYFDFMINFVGSAVGAVAIVAGGYVSWFFIKKRGRIVEA
ncbi:hypothetical protein KEJ45_07320 [Candidatus Bathyarchaeota archaeon]|nr:hypothetical protein [Candidatus Bathyarchaeota archaeon]